MKRCADGVIKERILEMQQLIAKWNKNSRDLEHKTSRQLFITAGLLLVAIIATIGICLMAITFFKTNLGATSTLSFVAFLIEIIFGIYKSNKILRSKEECKIRLRNFFSSKLNIILKEECGQEAYKLLDEGRGSTDVAYPLRKLYALIEN